MRYYKGSVKAPLRDDMGKIKLSYFGPLYSKKVQMKRAALWTTLYYCQKGSLRKFPYLRSENYSLSERFHHYHFRELHFLLLKSHIFYESFLPQPLQGWWHQSAHESPPRHFPFQEWLQR